MRRGAKLHIGVPGLVAAWTLFGCGRTAEPEGRTNAVGSDVGSSSAASASSAPQGTELRVKGAKASVPASYESLAEASLDKMRQNQVREGTVEVQVAAAREKDTSALVSLTLDERRYPANQLVGTVETTLSAMIESQRRQLGDQALEWTVGKDGEVLTLKAKIQSAGPDGRPTTMHLRNRVAMLPNRTLRAFTLVCTEGAEAAACDTLRAEAIEFLPLATRLSDEPAATTGAAGFAFGGTKADFVAACKRGGHAVDRYGDTLTPRMRTWHTDGKIARCDGAAASGPPEAAWIGKPSLVDAIFVNDRLARLVLYSRDAPAERAAAVRAALPCYVDDEATGACLFDPLAGADEAALVAVSPSASIKGGSAITIETPRHLDTPLSD